MRGERVPEGPPSQLAEGSHGSFGRTMTTMTTTSKPAFASSLAKSPGCSEPLASSRHPQLTRHPLHRVATPFVPVSKCYSFKIRVVWVRKERDRERGKVAGKTNKKKRSGQICSHFVKYTILLYIIKKVLNLH